MTPPPRVAPYPGSQISRVRRLLAVRHAPTSSAGLCVGDGEAPCTISDAAAADRIMLSMIERGVVSVWTSPSERCRGPATLVAERMQVPLRVDERLREISLGTWQLRSWASIEASEPVRYKSWLENWLTEAPPGAELPSHLLRRVGEWWNHLLAGQHLLVSHAGVNRALRVLVDRKTWQEVMTMPVPHLQGESFRQLIEGPCDPRQSSRNLASPRVPQPTTEGSPRCALRNLK